MEYILSAITMFQKGGVVMYILLLCSIFVIAIGIERGLFFTMPIRAVPLPASLPCGSITKNSR